MRQAAMAFSVSATLFIHLHFEGGKQPLERKPGSRFTASSHFSGERGQEGPAQQHWVAEEEKGYGRAKVTPHCDRAGTTRPLGVGDHVG